MTINPNNTRYKDYFKWEKRDKTKYDYKRKGLLKHLTSSHISQSKNPFTIIIYNYIEQTIYFLLDYVKILNNFKNPANKNR